ncbi:MAG: Na(+)-translocating NADH-quinone reductase subunit A [Microscillaceae bacterium]|jgi:Na+-transporting NADH:ubiquinone oxidoreductase subunit A|nr:Na(+)-translocating NADH-quinone reductase subunit A [Microscillaceae bacterium]
MYKKLSKGFDIRLVGKAQEKLVDTLTSDTFCFKPTDFKNITRPKVLVQEGDTVKAGTPIFLDKMNEKAVFASPVSGEVVAVERGAKRVPLAIKILADKQVEYLSFTRYSESELAQLSADQALEAMLSSGVWANIIERPFGIVAHPDSKPKALFISAFDSNPLAPDYEFVFKGEEKYLQAGITALSKIVPKIHLTVRGGKSSLFKSLKGATIHEFAGPHPAGNVGVQIHHIDAINKGETVWTISPYGLQQIGRLFLEGRYDASKTIAVAGSEVKTPQYHRIISGVSVAKLIENNLKSDNIRLISGNALSGEKVGKDGYLGFYANTLTVLPEGNQHEFLGWILPSFAKISFQRTFGLFSFLSPAKERIADTNLHGEERAFVQTGVFEQVLPMDILPMFLFKAIMANDLEAMEELGIYELLEEDVALCEFVDVSKNDLQTLLREGLEALQSA